MSRSSSFFALDGAAAAIDDAGMGTHDATSGQVSSAAALVYDEFFVPALFAQWPGRMLDLVGLAAGDVVLDVGCGTGVLARAASRRLRGDGAVVGVDVNEGMLAVARMAPEVVTWQRAAAESLPFPASTFDRVVSQFALMFFADRELALAEMARVLRPGGGVAVATWAAVEESPGYAAMVTLLHRLFGPRHASMLLAPFVLGSASDLERLMSTAFEDVAVVRAEGVARFASPEAWVHTDVRGWTLAGMIDDEQFDALMVAAADELTEFVLPDGGVAFPAPALIATARA